MEKDRVVDRAPIELLREPVVKRSAVQQMLQVELPVRAHVSLWLVSEPLSKPGINCPVGGVDSDVADVVACGMKPLPQSVARFSRAAFCQERVPKEPSEARITGQQRLTLKNIGHVRVRVTASVIGMREAVVADYVTFVGPAAQHLTA